MRQRFLTTFLVLFTLLSVGCATRTEMAFKNDADRITEKSKPIYLMTATIKNNYKNSWPPETRVVYVEKAGATKSEDRLNFLIDPKAKNDATNVALGSSYLIRMEIEPGQYVIRGLGSSANSFPILGNFFTPIHADLSSKDAGVFYLGRVTATVRERQGNEFKAGPSVPLIDQAVVGASGGTFDVAISDEFTADETVFRNKFPALKDVKIQKSILPPFDRAKAQQWWEAN